MFLIWSGNPESNVLVFLEMSTMNEQMEEGYSTQRPPMVDGKFYTNWKNRMEIFIKAEKYQVWRVIEIGDFEVTTTNSNNEIIPKPITDYDKEDFQKM